MAPETETSGVVVHTIADRSNFEETIAEWRRTTPKFIVTHDGTFHLDEVLACRILLLLPEFEDASIVRTRDTEFHNTLGSIVVDVGGRFDVAAKRFDHHQRDFMETFDDNHKRTKMSSAGLVWKYYGREILKLIRPQFDNIEIDMCHVAMYDYFFERIDAVDNGVRSCMCPPKYIIEHPVSLSGLIGSLNPNFNVVDYVSEQTKKFKEAMKVSKKEFDDAIHFICEGWLPAKSHFENAIRERHQIHPSGQIIEIERFIPWIRFMNQWDIENYVSCVIYQKQYGRDPMWHATSTRREWKSADHKMAFRDLMKDQLVNADIIYLGDNSIASKTREALMEQLSRIIVVH